MQTRSALIIGGNKGIGKALVEGLARRWGNTGQVYFTARDAAVAQSVATEIKAATGHDVQWFCFDLADPGQAAEIAEKLRSQHGALDLVVQNGAYIPRAGRPAADDARPMIEANSHGTLRVLEAFTPLLAEGGQLMIVASGLGVLSHLDEPLRRLFDTRTLSPQQINQNIDQYVIAAEAGTAEKSGWPEWVNIPSKVAQVALTRSFARRARENHLLPDSACIYAACPGVTLTDATRDFLGTVFDESDVQTPAEAAEGLLQMLCSPATRHQHGELLQHGKVLPFGD